MTKQLLFYERAVPVSAQRHGDWSLEPRKDYGFAGHTNSVPLAAVEFPAAAMEYPVVFAGKDEAVQPVAILGLKNDENRYLDDKGGWKARYIPAFVRRYPFVFSKSAEENRFILCIDEECAGWNQEDRGQRLFDANGERTEFLEKMLKFVQDYQQQFARTLALCKELSGLGLLEPMAARFKHPSGKQAELTGFMAVSRDKLKELPGDKLAEMAKSGALELVYVHLQSMRNFRGMLERASGGDGEGGPSFEDAGFKTDEHVH